MRAPFAAILAASALVVAVHACNSASYLPPGHISVPCIAPPMCGSPAVSANITSFTLANGTTAMPEPTQVNVCYDSKYLHLTYIAAQDKFMKNTYMQCNTETWNQEVMEMFIADYSAPMTAGGDPTLYTEIELTPHNVLYVAKIHNPYGNGTGKYNTMIPCSQSGIIHTVQPSGDDPHHTWIGHLQVPWALVSTAGKPIPEALYRVNFFRVAMFDNVNICAADSCNFGCWSPTYTSPPSFHVTPYFGVMKIAASS